MSPPRQLLVLINPTSGQGKAVTLFNEKVLPRLTKSNITCHVVITTGANHARSLAETLNLGKWTDLCVVSGDGLLFELVNGLLCHKSDPATALLLPISIIPAGSGNGILATVLSYQGHNVRRSVEFERGAVDSLIVAEPNPFSLLHIETRTQSFASVGVGVMWGFLADCDIESEKYRSILGSRRFVAQALIRIANLRRYHGRISFLRAPGVQLPGKQHTQYPYSRDLPPADETAPDPALIQQRKRSSHSTSSQNRSESAGDFDEDPSFTNRELLNSVLQSRTEVSMPRIDDPVPDHWEVMEGDFLFVCMHSVSHLSTDILAMSSDDWQPDPGFFYLTVLKGSFSRFKIASWLSKLETGEVYHDDALEVIPILAFRLEPTGAREGIITVDGELVRDPGMIQGHLTNWKATIMGPGAQQGDVSRDEQLNSGGNLKQRGAA